MTSAAWKRLIADATAGLKANLSGSAPRSATDRLDEVHNQAMAATTSAMRRSVETQLNALVEETPYFRAAARRYLGPQVTKALRDAARTLDRANRVLREAKRSLAKSKQTRDDFDWRNQ